MGLRRLRFNDLQVDAPDGWRDRSSITLVGTDSKTLAPSVVLTREDAPSQPLGTFAKSQVAGIARHVQQHQLVSERGVVIAGREAHLLEHRFLTPERQRAHQLQYFFVHGDDVVVLTLTCAEKELAARTPVFTHLIETLQLGPEADGETS